MKAYLIERGTTFSIDGGVTWLVAITEVREDDNDNMIFLACDRENFSLGASKEYCINAYEHVWEPDPEALNRGDNFLPVKTND